MTFNGNTLHKHNPGSYLEGKKKPQRKDYVVFKWVIEYNIKKPNITLEIGESSGSNGTLVEFWEFGGSKSSKSEATYDVRDWCLGYYLIVGGVSV